MLVLVINSGSSSVKYQVRDSDMDGPEAVRAEGTIERIGEDTAPDHAAALRILSDEVAEALGNRHIGAVGHRVVHGGERFDGPVLITPEIAREIDRLSPLAPLHNPSNLLGIRAISELWPELPQVAVFDTAFHRTLPEHAWRYAIPDKFYTRHGIRRYGFHGTSYEFVTRQAARLLHHPLEEFNAVIAHLGNGASVTAIAGGRSIDTSMGFTPLEGLVMGTRSGDLDPSIVVYLQRQGWDADQLDDLLNEESGLQALAGRSDMRSIAEAGGDRQAQLALSIASYRLVKYIGSYHVAVGGAQAIVFTAGIGENSPRFRQAVVDGLGPIGVQLSPPANQSIGSAEGQEQTGVISAPDSAIPVLVVPTDEERAIAEATAVVVGAGG